MTSARERIADLVAEYGLLLDEDKLEAWADLFTADCDYRIVMRENVEQGLPHVLMWCDTRDMLRDRVDSYRHVNEYNLHWDRHVIGPIRYAGEADGTWTIEASYSLFQTDREGASRLFSVGRYRAEVVFEGDAPRFKSMLVIADTGLVPSLLATPI
jgi:anthranilate 1,2-dioxygenase small subunit